MSKRDGVRAQCKACSNAASLHWWQENKLSAAAKRKLRNQTNPELNNRWQMKYRHGITPEEMQAMFEKQGSRCGVCLCVIPRKEPKWCIDHDHATDKIRGVLCRPCNAALGMLEDRIEYFEQAIAYLKLHQAEAK